MADEGWEVHVVCAPGPLLDERRASPTVMFHSVSMARNPSPVQDLRSFFALLRLIRRVRPDLISVGTPKVALLGSFAGFVARTPHRILHQRGLRLETESGLKRAVLWAMERITVLSSHQVLAVSPSLATALLENKLVSANKVTVLGRGSSNGVDVSEFADERFSSERLASTADRLGLEPGVPVIGYVGRLTIDKGFDVLEQAVALLQERGTLFSLLVVGGLDDPESRIVLERLTASGINIAVAGAVADPAEYFRLMDVFVLPTLREGYPNVVLEAGASGLATVTTTATGAIDSVRDGTTGFIVPMGDSVKMANALQALIDDPVLRRRLGENAYEDTVANFNRPEVWELLVKYYSEQLGS